MEPTWSTATRMSSTISSSSSAAVGGLCDTCGDSFDGERGLTEHLMGATHRQKPAVVAVSAAAAAAAEAAGSDKPMMAATATAMAPAPYGEVQLQFDEGEFDILARATEVAQILTTNPPLQGATPTENPPQTYGYPAGEGAVAVGTPPEIWPATGASVEPTAWKRLPSGNSGGVPIVPHIGGVEAIKQEHEASLKRMEVQVLGCSECPDFFTMDTKELEDHLKTCDSEKREQRKRENEQKKNALQVKCSSCGFLTAKAEELEQHFKTTSCRRQPVPKAVPGGVRKAPKAASRNNIVLTGVKSKSKPRQRVQIKVEKAGAAAAAASAVDQNNNVVVGSGSLLFPQYQVHVKQEAHHLHQQPAAPPFNPAPPIPNLTAEHSQHLGSYTMSAGTTPAPNMLPDPSKQLRPCAQCDIGRVHTSAWTFRHMPANALRCHQCAYRTGFEEMLVEHVRLAHNIQIVLQKESKKPTATATKPEP